MSVVALLIAVLVVAWAYHRPRYRPPGNVQRYESKEALEVAATIARKRLTQSREIQ